MKRLFIIGLVLAFAGITHATNTLKIQNVEVAQGGSVTLGIALNNETANLMGWQCDMVLPEGLSLALKSNGKPVATLGNRFSTTAHTISSSRLTNGDYRFIATSMDGEAIPGTSGTLFTVTLLADASVTQGTTLKGTLKNIEFNTQDNQKLALDDLTFSVTIPAAVAQKCATPTVSMENGKLKFACATEGATCHYTTTGLDNQSGDGAEMSLSSAFQISVYATKEGYTNSETVTKDIKISMGAKGDVNGDGKVSISDAVSVVNIILAGGEGAPARQVTISEDIVRPE